MGIRALTTLLLAGVLVLAIVGGQRGVLGVLAESPHDPTQVCGAINANTTWIPANSPYQLTCSVSVASGVTLTIQPGVTITGSGTSDSALQISGTLIANGAAGAPITISWSPQSTFASGIQFLAGASTSSSIAYADISGSPNGAVIGYPGSALDHVSIHDNPGAGVQSQTVGAGYSSSLQVTNSRFYNNGGISVEVGIGVGTFTMTNTSVTDTIDNNSDPSIPAVYLYDVDSGKNSAASVHLHQDNFSNNPYLNLLVLPPQNKNKSGLSLDATNNYWGTSNPTQIQSTIYDCHHDASSTTSPCVNFSGYAASAFTGDQGAGSGTATTTATTTPTVTVTVTETATATPTTTGTPVTPTPTATLFSSGVSTATPTFTAVATATSTPTPVPTDTPTATPTRTPTRTPTAVPPKTHTPTPRPTATSKPTQHSFFTIDKVEVLHRVGSRTVATSTVKIGETATFSMQYHPVISKTLPTGTVSITRNGKMWHSYPLAIDVGLVSGHIEATYHTVVTFRQGAPTGQLYAHFRLRLQDAVAKRDRKFTVKAK